MTVSLKSMPQTRSTFRYKYSCQWRNDVHEVWVDPVKNQYARRVSRSGQCRSNMLEGQDVDFWRSIVNWQKWPTMRGWVSIVLMVALHASGVFSLKLRCIRPNHVVPVSEVLPAGTVFLTLNVTDNNTWEWTPHERWHTNYVTFSNKSNKYTMAVVKPLDLEEIVPLYGKMAVFIRLPLTCSSTNLSRGFVSFISVEAVDEYAPKFNQSNIQVTVKESVPVSQPLIQLSEWVTDEDINPNQPELAAFFFLSYEGDYRNDGRKYLRMFHRLIGTVTSRKQLDYDSLPASKKYLVVGVKVQDYGRLTGTASLTVNIEDDDDLPPEFYYDGCVAPCNVIYSVAVSPFDTGLVTGIRPAPIQARDRDSLNYSVEFHIVKGPKGFDTFISLDKETGEVTILEKLQDLGWTTIVFIIEAREVSAQALSNQTILLMDAHFTPVMRVSNARAGADPGMVVVLTVVVIVIIWQGAD